MSDTTIRYMPPLDGLRALAALLLAAYHSKVPGLAGGFLGVDVFFVLSGYLITRQLTQSPHVLNLRSIVAFWGRRLRRLYPALLVFLSFYLLVCPWLFTAVDWERHLRDAGWTALYIANFARFHGSGMAILGHVWSLCVEMQFYLVWPFAIMLLSTLKKSHAIVALLFLWLIASGWRWIAFDNAANGWDIYERPDTRCSGLILGSLLGYINPTPKTKNLQNTILISLSFLTLYFCISFFSYPWKYTARYGFTITELCAAALIFLQPAWLGNTLLAWMGKISYGFYLWHLLTVIFARNLNWNWPSTLLLTLTFGTLAATLSYYAVEKKFYKRRVAM